MGWFKDYLVAYKLQYFLNFAGLAASSPFLHVYARQLGFSQISVGWIFAAAPFVDMVLKPVMCSLADRRQVARGAFLVLLAVTALCLTAMRWVPPLSGEHSVSANSSVISSYNFTTLPDNFTIPPGGSKTSPDSSTILPEGDPSRDVRQYQFWVYAVLLLLAWTAVSTNQTMFDGMTAKVTERVGADYGRQRLWGTVGYGTMAVASGYLIEALGDGTRAAYSIGFYLTGALLSLDLILCLCFIQLPPLPQHRISWREVRCTMRRWPALAFSACCTAIGVSTGLVWGFQFWYLDDLGMATGYPKSGVKLLQGLTYLVKAITCEIPLMFMSGAVLSRLGHRLAVALSMALLGVYLLIYSQLGDPWYCLLAEPLSGAAFGLLYPAIASYACRIAPSGTAVTTQSIMAASFDGLGVGVGTLLSSYFYTEYGGRLTFLWFGAATLCVAAVYLGISSLAERYIGSDASDGTVEFRDDAVVAISHAKRTEEFTTASAQSDSAYVVSVPSCLALVPHEKRTPVDTGGSSTTAIADSLTADFRPLTAQHDDSDVSSNSGC